MPCNGARHRAVAKWKPHWPCPLTVVVPRKASAYGKFEMAKANPEGCRSIPFDFLAGNGNDLACLVGQARRSMADASQRHSD
jgi:hypothetical protein